MASTASTTLNGSMKGLKNVHQPVINGDGNRKHTDKDVPILEVLPNDLASREVMAEVAPSSSHSMNGGGSHGLTDFFNTEIFQIVLHNPTTAHRLLKFCETRFCSENMEFLEKVDRCNTLLDELMTNMSLIHRSFISPEAPRQLNLPPAMMKKINADMRTTILSTLPSVESIFADAQDHVENMIAVDIYPRFVKYQITKSATRAFSMDRTKYAGLGDCFCLTDPALADNPIVYASDGFVKVTGYSRTDIIPRNCRFLQGNYTDRVAVKRLLASIDANQETVELLLNYKRNGDPFWNLLYVAPLFNANGKVSFYLGGQINCSTAIHNYSDILRVLSLSDNPENDMDETLVKELTASPTVSTKRKFFKALIGGSRSRKTEVREAGMEQGLLNKIEKMDFSTQTKMFYTAYSKYLVINYSNFTIEFFSAGVLDILLPNAVTGTVFIGNDIFRVLGQHALAMPREFKSRVRDSIKAGRAISVDINLTTRKSVSSMGTERFATHWTPLKDEHGAARYVVVTLSLGL